MTFNFLTFNFLALYFFAIFFCYKNVEGFKNSDSIKSPPEGDFESPFSGDSNKHDENIDKEGSTTVMQNVHMEENNQSSNEDGETRKDIGETEETVNDESNGDNFLQKKSQTYKACNECNEDKETDMDEAETAARKIELQNGDKAESNSIFDFIKKQMDKKKRKDNRSRSHYNVDDAQTKNKSNVDYEVEIVDENKRDVKESVENDKTSAPEEIEVSDIVNGDEKSSTFIKDPINLPFGSLANLYNLYGFFDNKHHKDNFDKTDDTDDVTIDMILDQMEASHKDADKAVNKASLENAKKAEVRRRNYLLSKFVFMERNIYKATNFIVPGIGGSTLLAEYKDAYIPSCQEEALTSQPFRIWISISRLLSLRSNLFCTIDTLKLLYDKRRKMYHNQKGVKVDVERYGHLKGINYLDYLGDVGISATKYFHDMTHYFITHGQYVSNESLIGAPYDWRYSIKQQNYTLFKYTIEYTYEKRNKYKVNLIGHSLGCLFINYFLTHKVDKKWKQKYINSIIYLNGPFKGSMKTVRSLVHGNGDFISLKLLEFARFQVPDAVMKGLNSSLGSIIDLIPYREYYNRDQIVIIMNLSHTPISKKDMNDLIKTCGLYNVKCYKDSKRYSLRIYTLSNWTSLLSTDIQERIKEQKKYMDRQYKKDHGVPIFCVNSMMATLQTEQVLFFQTTDVSSDPYIFYGAGDGTVNAESLNACNLFYNRRETKIFMNVDHLGIVKDKEAIQYVYKKATCDHRPVGIGQIAYGGISERFVVQEESVN